MAPHALLERSNISKNAAAERLVARQIERDEIDDQQNLQNLAQPFQPTSFKVKNVVVNIIAEESEPPAIGKEKLEIALFSKEGKSLLQIDVNFSGLRRSSEEVLKNFIAMHSPNQEGNSVVASEDLSALLHEIAFQGATISSRWGDTEQEIVDHYRKAITKASRNIKVQGIILSEGSASEINTANQQLLNDPNKISWLDASGSYYESDAVLAKRTAVPLPFILNQVNESTSVAFANDSLVIAIPVVADHKSEFCNCNIDEICMVVSRNQIVTFHEANGKFIEDMQKDFNDSLSLNELNGRSAGSIALWAISRFLNESDRLITLLENQIAELNSNVLKSKIKTDQLFEVTTRLEQDLNAMNRRLGAVFPALSHLSELYESEKHREDFFNDINPTRMIERTERHFDSIFSRLSALHPLIDVPRKAHEGIVNTEIAKNLKTMTLATGLYIALDVVGNMTLHFRPGTVFSAVMGMTLFGVVSAAPTVLNRIKHSLTQRKSKT